MSKQIQIDRELFINLCDYFLGGEEELADNIKEQLDSKLDKLIARELFTKYKRSTTGAEREQARQAYLAHKGILQAWRSEQEYHLPEPPDED